MFYGIYRRKQYRTYQFHDFVYDTGHVVINDTETF